MWAWIPWYPKYEIAAKKSPNGEFNGGWSPKDISFPLKPLEVILILRSSEGESLTQVLILRATLTVVGSAL
jgi:hypothetical protein